MGLSEAAAVGVDGCKAGWIAVSRGAAEPPAATVFPSFPALVDRFGPDAVIAVDMPIGLPDHCGHGGRGPEALVRRHLGQRQSSVFSIPSRAAVYAECGPFPTLEAWYDAHRRASAVARATSDPSRAISIQAFGIFSKIRELDAALRENPHLRGRVFESHPEMAFCMLNGGSAMTLPKKIKGRINPAGMEERRALLAAQELPRSFLDAPPPRGAGEDDFLDACAVLLVAERVRRGQARCFPDPPERDAHGIPVAIWA